jgi:hypothetical protein
VGLKLLPTLVIAEPLLTARDGGAPGTPKAGSTLGAAASVVTAVATMSTIDQTMRATGGVVAADKASVVTTSRHDQERSDVRTDRDAFAVGHHGRLAAGWSMVWIGAGLR